MNPADPNLALLELIAEALGPLRERLVFVGGCTTGMLVTDIAAAPVRATRDVDVIVEGSWRKLPVAPPATIRQVHDQRGVAAGLPDAQVGEHRR